MYISVLELFKVGIGPSSSHTVGPMLAAADFINRIGSQPGLADKPGLTLRCVLKGSLAYTGRGHGTDRAVVIGLRDISPQEAAMQDIDALSASLAAQQSITTLHGLSIGFSPIDDIIFDSRQPMPEHPNGLIFELHDQHGNLLLTETYFSIGGGFIKTLDEINDLVAPLDLQDGYSCPYPFDSAAAMLRMAQDSNLSIAEMKRANELHFMPESELSEGLGSIWQAMQRCLHAGLQTEGTLPGGLNLPRRAATLHSQLKQAPQSASIIDWLTAYAMAVNEENAAGHLIVTAPTNGAAGVIPAILHQLVEHEQASQRQVEDFLLTASAIGGLIKHRSSLSGAEVGCQGEVGAAAAMAAAGLCEVQGGTAAQVENAAEIALEHHLGMTCDPVNGLVQVPCIERNGFGAIKAYTAAKLALRGDGSHFMPLDNCIAAMRQTGMEMSAKFKETALGGLAVSLTEC